MRDTSKLPETVTEIVDLLVESTAVLKVDGVNTLETLVVGMKAELSVEDRGQFSVFLAFPIAHQGIYMQNSVMGGFYEKLQIFSNGKN